MEEWKYIQSENDIQEFLDVTMGMHDSYIVSVDYMAGTWGDDGTTYFAGPDKKNVRVIFDGLWADGKIEMVFEAVSRFSVAGWQSRYLDEMYECRLELKKLKKTSDETYIVWTNGSLPRECSMEKLLDEPFCTYIVAKRARWRIVKLNYKCPCCGYYTFTHPPLGEFDYCPVCCWLDDTECLEDLDYVSAGLGISLKQGSRNFLINRACKKELVDSCRLPLETEFEGIDWIRM